MIDNLDDPDNIMSESEFIAAMAKLKTIYNKNETKQKWRIRFNTYALTVAIIVGVLSILPLINNTNDLYEKFSGIEAIKITNSEIAQIASDEGYRRCQYKDSVGLKTIGFGTLVEGTDTPKCIDPHQAVILLRKHYEIAKASVDKKYPWADDKEKLVLINLSYNMGETRLAKFEKTLKHMKEKRYDSAAGELLNSRYAHQVPLRAGRMAGRIMELSGE